MTKITNYRMPYRRRREAKTNYAKRLALIKSRLPRMVIRKTNKGLIIQFVEFAQVGDRIIYGATTQSLSKSYGWPAKRNASTAYLMGLYAAAGAKKKGIKTFVADIGMHTPSKGSILFAALKGAVDAGLETSYDEENVPNQKINNVSEPLKQSFESVKKRILS